MTTYSDTIAQTLEMQSAFFDLPGLRLHAVVAGPEDGPLVVLLHGFPEFWYGWRRQIRPLAEAGYRVVAPDQRGYNLTGKNRPFDIFTLTRDVRNLIAACGREWAYVAGHDWGAAIAWTLAEYYPEAVRRLAILNVPHPAVMAKAVMRDPGQMLKSWYIGAIQIPYWPEWLLERDDFKLLADGMRRSAHPGTFSDEDIERYKQAWRQPVALRTMLAWYRVTFSALRSVRAYRYRRVEQPVLILWGDGDAFLSTYMADESLEWCENGRVVHFPNATHWVQHEEAPAVTEYLLEHFRG